MAPFTIQITPWTPSFSFIAKVSRVLDNKNKFKKKYTLWCWALNDICRLPSSPPWLNPNKWPNLAYSSTLTLFFLNRLGSSFFCPKNKSHDRSHGRWRSPLPLSSVKLRAIGVTESGNVPNMQRRLQLIVEGIGSNFNHILKRTKTHQVHQVYDLFCENQNSSCKPWIWVWSSLMTSFVFLPLRFQGRLLDWSQNMDERATALRQMAG